MGCVNRDILLSKLDFYGVICFGGIREFLTFTLGIALHVNVGGTDNDVMSSRSRVFLQCSSTEKLVRRFTQIMGIRT